MSQTGSEVAVFTTSIAEYSPTAAALAELKQKYEKVIFEVATKEGMAAAIAGRAELRKIRINLEKTRIEIKAPALKRTQEIDSEARRITGILESLETPIDDQIKADERKKQAEAEAKAKAEADRLAQIEADRKAAEEKELQAKRDELARQAAELEAKQKAQQESEAAARAKIEAEQREARQKIEQEQAAARKAREAEEAQAKAIRDAENKRIADEQAAEAKRIRESDEKLAAERRALEDAQRKAREEQELRDRETRRVSAELQDAKGMLKTFVDRYAKIEEFSPVIKAINAYFKGQK